MDVPKFTDRFGREWQVEVNVGILPALAAAGLAKLDDSASVMTAGAWAAGQILWAFCAEHASERKIDHHGFAKGLNAKALCSGTDAVILAVKIHAMRLEIKAKLEEEELRRTVGELNTLRAKHGLAPLEG